MTNRSWPAPASLALPVPKVTLRRGWFNRAVFCVGMAVVTFSQLRVVGPFGLGEFILLGWAGFTVFSPAWRVRKSARLWPTTVLGLYLVLSLIGTPVGLILGKNPPGTAMRFTAAIALVSLITMALTYHADRAAIIATWAKWWPILAVGPNFLAYLISTRQSTFLGLRLLDGDYAAYFRFQGLTTNPNQLAMIAGCALFVSLDQFRRARRKAGPVILAFLSLVVGYYSGSDAFRVSLLAAGASAVAIVLLNKRRTFGGALLLVGAWLVILVGLISANSILQAGNNLSSSQNGQGSERELLWGKCASILLRYPLAGIGPTTPVSTSVSPTLTECHNSYLDIGTGGGVLAVFSMVALLIYIGRRYWRAKDPVKLGMLVWLATFMVFGYQGRHPIFWMILLWMAAPDVPMVSKQAAQLRLLPKSIERSSYV